MKYVLLAVLLFWAMATVPSSTFAGEGTPGVFRVSMIPKKDLDQQIEEMRPLFNQLESELGMVVEVVRHHSYRAVIEGLLSNSIDLALLGPASYARAYMRSDQIEAFASLSKKKGVYTPEGSYYQSVLFCLSGTARSLEQLQGGRLALTDPNSTSGALIPKVEFPRTSGQDLGHFFPSRIYSGSHDRAIRAVLKGYADAAFVSSARLDEAFRKGEFFRENIRILWRSGPIHYDPFVFRGGLPQGIKARVRKVFFSNSANVQAVMEAKEADGIVPVKGSDYKTIHELVRQESGASG